MILPLNGSYIANVFWLETSNSFHIILSYTHQYYTVKQSNKKTPHELGPASLEFASTKNRKGEPGMDLHVISRHDDITAIITKAVAISTGNCEIGKVLPTYWVLLCCHFCLSCAEVSPTQLQLTCFSRNSHDFCNYCCDIIMPRYHMRIRTRLSLFFSNFR